MGMPQEHVTTVCKMGQGAACCRYLTAGMNGFDCEKHTSLGRTIDGRVEQGIFTSVGDNCPGWEDA